MSRAKRIEEAARAVDRLLLSEADGGLPKGAIQGIYRAAVNLRAALALPEEESAGGWTTPGRWYDFTKEGVELGVTRRLVRNPGIRVRITVEGEESER